MKAAGTEERIEPLEAETAQDQAVDPRWSTIRPASRERFETVRPDIPVPPMMPSDLDDGLFSEDRIEVALPPELVQRLRSLDDQDTPLQPAERAELAIQLAQVLRSSRPPANSVTPHAIATSTRGSLPSTDNTARAASHASRASHAAYAPLSARLGLGAIIVLALFSSVIIGFVGTWWLTR